MTQRLVGGQTTLAMLLAGEGLKPSANGVRVRFSGAERAVVEGPFPEARSLVAGFWLWRVRSMAEAVAWARRCPNPTGGQSELEIRPVLEADDFGDEFTPELRADEDRLRDQLADR